jgi:hypothetical protein
MTYNLTRKDVENCKKYIVNRNISPLSYSLIDDGHYEVNIHFFYNYFFKNNNNNSFCENNKSVLNDIINDIESMTHENILFYVLPNNELFSILIYNISKDNTYIDISIFCVNQRLNYKYGYIIFNNFITAANKTSYNYIILFSYSKKSDIFYKKLGFTGDYDVLSLNLPHTLYTGGLKNKTNKNRKKRKYTNKTNNYFL